MYIYGYKAQKSGSKVPSRVGAGLRRFQRGSRQVPDRFQAIKKNPPKRVVVYFLYLNW